MSYAISLVVPFYEGNRYLDGIIKNFNDIKDNFLMINKEIDLELILVNDSPHVKVNVELLKKANFKYKVIANKKNFGIHYSRVIGVRNAENNWIIFLDQDDELEVSNFYTQVKSIDDCDGEFGVIGNGMYEYKNEEKKIFKNEKIATLSLRESSFLKIRNLITSPGQCIINKKLIPNYWKDNILKNNGSDDWFLWILIKNDGLRFKINDTIVYKHKLNKNGNYSNDYDKMHLSNIEMLTYLEKNEKFEKKN
ncbi:glycosyltransferase [Liquorilactobacillus mali]|uniref:glycosyltransferase n=1 Tax=Liquorilactobacillus mali TaxID=1618 RepID=UPI000249168E|nr:glycosyltransferase [Liquorilactobacillus mali]